MDGAYPASASRPLATRRRARGIAALALGVALTALAVAALAWARGYQPIAFGQGAYGADVRDGGKVVRPVGSTGKSVYFPRYRRNGSFYAMFTVTNTGRFDVELLGLPAEELSPPLFPKRLGVLNRCCHPAGGVSRVDDGHPLRIPAGEYKTLHIVYGMQGCVGGAPRNLTTGAHAGTDRVRLRYRYLRFFERTAFVEMPMELVLSCRKGIDPSRR